MMMDMSLSGFDLGFVRPQMSFNRRLTVANIKAEVAHHYRLRLSDIDSDRREREVARPRQVAMYLARHLTPKSLPAIGRRFGRDHTTVLHALRQIEKLKAVDAELANDIDVIRRRLAA